MSSCRSADTCSALDKPDSLRGSPLAPAVLLSLGGNMTNRSTTPPTALRTGSSAPQLLLTLSTLVTPRHTALAVAGKALTGSGEVHDWSFPTGSFDLAILGEVQAVLADLGARQLLRALGLTQQLPFELLEAYGPF